LEQLLEIDGREAGDGLHAEGRLSIVGPARTWVKAIAVLAVVAAGCCFWRSYAPRLRTHTELLVAMARKGADLVASGRLTAENMPELTYPLERAGAFARGAHSPRGTPAPG